MIVKDNSPSCIEVTLTEAEIGTYGPTSAIQQAGINDKLRMAGMPMKGAFTFDGVSTGNLVIFHDNVGQKVIFTWTAVQLPGKS